MTILDEVTPDELIAADFPIISEQTPGVDSITLAKGTAVGIVTASGKFDAFNAGGAGGLEIFHGILAEDFDSSVTTDKSAAIYLSGAINEDKIIFTGTGDKDTTRRLARTLGLYYKKVLAS